MGGAVRRARGPRSCRALARLPFTRVELVRGARVGAGGGRCVHLRVWCRRRGGDEPGRALRRGGSHRPHRMGRTALGGAGARCHGGRRADSRGRAGGGDPSPRPGGGCDGIHTCGDGWPARGRRGGDAAGGADAGRERDPAAAGTRVACLAGPARCGLAAPLRHGAHRADGQPGGRPDGRRDSGTAADAELPDAVSETK